MTPLTPEIIENYKECRSRNEIIVSMQEYIPLFSQYFKKEDLAYFIGSINPHIKYYVEKELFSNYSNNNNAEKSADNLIF